jgi:hypothetical protein
VYDYVAAAVANSSGGSSSSESVLYIAQSLTDEQKAQARTNIGAPSADHTHDYVPTSRTVNGKALSGNITLSASDVGAATSGHNHDGSYFKRYDLNAINVDSTDGNWTVDISADKIPNTSNSTGTVPELFVNVQQFTSGHFYSQVARKINPSASTTRKDTKTWTRSKYSSDKWSAWEKVYTESECSTNGITVQSATVSDTLKVSGTSNMGRINASNEYLTGSLYVGGKSSTTDGKKGVAFGASGNITMQGSSAPTLSFIVGSATSANAKVYANSDNDLKLAGKTNVIFKASDKDVASIKSDGSTGAIINFKDSIQIVNTNINKGLKFYATCLRPDDNSAGIELGQNSYRFGTIYTNTAVNTSSDRNLKTDIQPIDERYVNLFDRLEPVSYKLKGDNHDRDHLGFISQDIWAAMEEVGISDMEFGGFCRDVKTKEIIDEETGEVTGTEPVLNENGEQEYTYSLRYGEFIALNSKMIQLCRKTIQAQQESIAQLQEKLAELEAKLNAI